MYGLDSKKIAQETLRRHLCFIPAIGEIKMNFNLFLRPISLQAGKLEETKVTNIRFLLASQLFPLLGNPPYELL